MSTEHIAPRHSLSTASISNHPIIFRKLSLGGGAALDSRALFRAMAMRNVRAAVGTDD